MDLTLDARDEAFVAELRSWLADHLRPPGSFATIEAEVAWGREWQGELARGRWVGLDWPREFGGRGASPLRVALAGAQYARSRAPQPVNRVGLNLAGPTLLAWGTDAQRARFLPGILDASELWCQLFSEPEAGSDLASLTTRAEPTGG
ncbi:MAG: acyl-CoA dehydrogenase family protein, partial [Mycobacteriales bacterium]